MLYTLDGKQTSSSFNDHREAVDFQQLVNRAGPAKAIESGAPGSPATTATPSPAGAATTSTT